MKATTNALRHVGETVPWAKIVWYTNNIPKHSFITWMAMRKALKTLYKLEEWGLRNSSVCVLCNTEQEDVEHLFLGCYFARAILNGLLAALEFHRVALNWADEIQWCVAHFVGKKRTRLLMCGD